MSNIKMTRVKSSQIQALGHDGDETLAVRFNSGATYHYHGVPAEKFMAMKSSDSVGSFLHREIKPNHDFTKIDPKE